MISRNAHKGLINIVTHKITADTKMLIYTSDTRTEHNCVFR